MAKAKKIHQESATFKQPRNVYGTGFGECTVQLDSFVQFCLVDLMLKKSTARQHKSRIRKIIDACPHMRTEEIRAYLAQIENPYNYNNTLKTLRVYFRDFRGDITPVKTFKFTKAEWEPSRLFTRTELTEFYNALELPAERGLFLIYASSGRRRSEILELQLDGIDQARRIIMPNKNSQTKHSWYSFYNEEASNALQEHLKERRDVRRSGKLFPMRGIEKGRIFWEAIRKTGLEITPQSLRFWFSNEMARLDTPDRYVDAFQGRIPRSVLAKHYTDYSLEKLKATYEEAGLKVLE